MHTPNAPALSVVCRGSHRKRGVGGDTHVYTHTQTCTRALSLSLFLDLKPFHSPISFCLIPLSLSQLCSTYGCALVNALVCSFRVFALRRALLVFAIRIVQLAWWILSCMRVRGAGRVFLLESEQRCRQAGHPLPAFAKI